MQFALYSLQSCALSLLYLNLVLFPGPTCQLSYFPCLPSGWRNRLAPTYTASFSKTGSGILAVKSFVIVWPQPEYTHVSIYIAMNAYIKLIKHFLTGADATTK